MLKTIRQKGINTPVLLLMAKTEVEDRIEGLDMEADDYLPKPFARGEFLARVRAMLRREEKFTLNILKCGNISLNMQSYEFSNGKTKWSKNIKEQIVRWNDLMKNLLILAI